MTTYLCLIHTFDRLHVLISLHWALMSALHGQDWFDLYKSIKERSHVSTRNDKDQTSNHNLLYAGHVNVLHCIDTLE